MERAHKFGKMALNILDNGKMIKLMDLED